MQKTMPAISPHTSVLSMCMPYTDYLACQPFSPLLQTSPKHALQHKLTHSACRIGPAAAALLGSTIAFQPGFLVRALAQAGCSEVLL